MKNFVVLLLLTSSLAFGAVETGPANSVLRVPSGGGRAKFGSVNVASSVAVTGVLSVVNGGAGDEANELRGCGLSASVAANALTIALKQKDGSTNLSSTAPCYIGFRSSTANSGAYNQRSVTGALSLVVSAGSSLGHSNGVAQAAYIYALDNAGTVELAITSIPIEETELNSTTAEGGAGAADSASVVYSTTARSSVAFRLIGKIVSSQATAGTWASAMSLVAMAPVLSGSVSTSGANRLHLETFTMDNGSPCSSSPCTLNDSTSGITSVTRTGTGVYLVNFPVGTFSVAPVCTFQNVRNSEITMRSGGTRSATQYSNSTLDNANNPADTAFDGICVGKF